VRNAGGAVRNGSFYERPRPHDQDMALWCGRSDGDQRIINIDIDINEEGAVVAKGKSRRRSREGEREGEGEREREGAVAKMLKLSKANVENEVLLMLESRC
jgi:hypothetical protein